jgi:hypothetical protein
MSSSWERRWPPFLGGSPSGGGGCGSKLDDAGTAKTRVARRPDRRTYGGGGIGSTQSAWGERARVVVAPAPGAGISMGAWEAGLRVRRQSERQQSGPSGYAVGRKVIGDKNNSFWAETLFKLEFLYSRSTLSVQQLDDGWVWREGQGGPELGEKSFQLSSLLIV